MIALFNGFCLCMGLIVSIGPQNIELIRAGFLKQHPYLLASVYILFDVIFITIGVLGVASIISLNPLIEKILLICSVLLLFYLGIHAFARMQENSSLTLATQQLADSKQNKLTAMKTVRKGILLSTLNPLVILETVIIIGSTGSQYQSVNKLYFLIGAILASIGWFYTIAGTTQRFSHVFSRPTPQKILDAVAGFILCGTAVWLAYQHYH